MIEYKTPETVIAEIKMVRTKFAGTILITEGDSDYKFLKSFILGDKCYLLPAHGKANAVDCITLARNGSLKGILSFVDADHDRILNKLPKDENIVVTDYHDSEMLMIMSRAFDKIIEEYASNNKIRKFLQTNTYKNIRSALFSVCIPIGMLRLLSKKYDYNICFNKLHFKKFIDARKMELNIHSLVRYILANSPGHSLQTKDVIRALEKELFQNSYEIQQLCNGHDFAEILALSLRQAIGNCDSKIGNRGNIEKLLRIAYNFDIFRRTECCHEMVSWVNRNSGFEIFPEAIN